MTEPRYAFLKKICLLLTLTIFTSVNGHADQTALCSDYAKSSVLSHINNVKSECGFKGELWNPSLKQHQTWCLDGNLSLAKQNLLDRAQLLEECGRSMQRGLAWEETDFFIQNKLFGELINAVAMDDVDSLKLFEEQGVDLSFEWHLIDGGLLYWAISNQASKVVHHLIEEKLANPNLTSNGGPNPLVKLLNNAPRVNYRLLDYLLRKGARPNHGGEDFSDESYPLTTAASHNDLESVRLLLKYKADPNLYESVPPLMMAIYNNNSRMVDLLLSSGAKPNQGLNGLHCQKIHKTQSYGNLLAMDSAKEINNSRITAALVRLGAKTTEECLSGS